MRIIVIDDDKLVAMSLKTILESQDEIEVVAIGNSGGEAIELYNKFKPDIMLMDIRMEGMTGLEGGEKILRKDKEAKILYLTTFLDDEYIVKAIKIGAKGYILKQDYESIVPALLAVFGGQSVFGGEIIEKLPTLIYSETKNNNYEDFNLNSKEYEIILKIATGLSNKEIASQLFLSEGTVRNYISLILEKLELRDRTQLAVFYYNVLK